jgi:hypothetical protein
MRRAYRFLLCYLAFWARLHCEDHRIPKEERNMVSMDGGHITKAGRPNPQENFVGRQIDK